MKQIVLIFSLLLGCLTTAFAHSPTKVTVPQNGSVLDRVPDALVMTFTKPTRVTKVTLTHKTTTADHSQNLEMTEKKFVTTLKLEAKWMGVGDYLVEWRALAADGHPMSGSFAFQVTGQ